MATQYMQEKLEFAIVIAEELKGKAFYLDGEDADPRQVNSHTIAELVQTLIRIATSLHRRYEAECSYEWANTEAYAKATERKEKRAEKLVKPFGIECMFNDDPRGAPIKLKLPSGKTNDWGNEGYCVPTR